MSERRVLVVASGYPSVDDPTAGRFVADLVAALAEHGVARSSVVACEPVPTWGGGRMRTAQAAAIEELLGAGVGADAAGVFRAASPVAGAPGPIARPAVAAPTASTPPDVVVASRAAALEAVWPMALALAADADADAAGSAGRRGIDLVHAHMGLPDGAAAAVLASRHGLPLVITEHASTVRAIAADPRRHAAYRAGLMRAAAVVCVSEALAADVRTAVPEIADRIRVIPNAVAVDDFRAPPRSERRPGELLFVGYRKPTKGIAVLLEAFALVQRERPEVSLRLVGPPGPGSAEHGWHALAARLGVADSVSFEGPASRADVADAMARAALFVHPSPRETFGVVAAEALAAGLPVVAADSGGVTEVLGPDPDGVGAVVPAESAALLAAAIVGTLDRAPSIDPAELRRLARERFGAAAVAARTAEVYEAAMISGTATGTATERAANARQGEGRLVVIGGNADRVSAVLASAGRPLDAIVVTSRDPFVPTPGVDVRTVPGWAERLDARRAAQGAVGPGGMQRPGAAARLLRRPLAAVRELLWRLPGREERLLARARTAAAEALGDAIREAAGAQPVVVALDGFDALVALPLVRAGRAAAAPGAGRWLADALASPHAPAAGGREAAAAPDAASGDAPPPTPAPEP